MTTLGFERGASSTTGHRRFTRELDHIIDDARRTGRSTDPDIRQGLARAWSKVKIMQINGYRVTHRRAQRHPPRRGAGGDPQDVLVRIPPARS